jgi:hypothetical protein
MEVSGELHIPAALPLAKNLPVLIGYETGTQYIPTYAFIEVQQVSFD